MTDTVKLTKTQKNRLKDAPRIATGQDLTLDPYDRLTGAARTHRMQAQEITVSAKVRERQKHSYGYGSSGYRRGKFYVSVVDGEVYLDGRYNGHAFGDHEPFFNTWSGSGKASPYDRDDEHASDGTHVLRQADKVAKAMQALLVENDEPVPDEDEVRKQAIGQETNRLHHILRDITSIKGRLKESREGYIKYVLAGEAEDLFLNVRRRRDLLDVEKMNIERKQQGQPPLRPEGCCANTGGDCESGDGLPRKGYACVITDEKGTRWRTQEEKAELILTEFGR